MKLPSHLRGGRGQGGVAPALPGRPEGLPALATTTANWGWARVSGKPEEKR